MPQEDLITLAQAAEDYDVPLFTLYSAKRAGHIPIAREAQPIKVWRVDVEAWLKERGRYNEDAAGDTGQDAD